ncbi:MAG: DNA-3-methyladenine glycosylase 2 family protein [Chloroflexi bacterium]|nr:DNA-3-methyladenine glycosylase 2 family protein [Chloroflexota bacterium]MYD49606.1 DNA-3-methyladenine glycosylase 2 family protein [Chloroflexota bacterium]
METTLETIIRPVAPYDFELTAGQPNYSRDQEYKTEDYVDGAYIRLLDLGDKALLASVRSVGSLDEPELAVTLTGNGLTDDDAERAAAQLAWLLGCNQDLRPFYDSVGGDSILAEVVREFYGYHNTRTASVFEALVQAVMGQQIATAVARIVRNLLIEHYGVRASIGGREWYAFPRAESLATAEVDDLRQLKLSVRKSEYIQGIARAALESADGFEGMHELPDEEVIQRMVALRGVGQWTAQWVLVRALARPDGFPIGDLALRRTVAALYFDGAEITDGELLAFSGRWSPWRSYATAYLFAALRSGRVAGS